GGPHVVGQRHPHLGLGGAQRLLGRAGPEVGEDLRRVRREPHVDAVPDPLHFALPTQIRCFSPRTYSRPFATAGVADTASPTSFLASDSNLSGWAAKTTALPFPWMGRTLPSTSTGEAEQGPASRLRHFSSPDLAS